MKLVSLVFLPCAGAWMQLWLHDKAPEVRDSVLDDTCYSEKWPQVKSCSKWWTNETHRIVEGNGIPNHDERGNRDAVLGPYCPFGAGDERGYCLPAEGDACPFAGKVCPSGTISVELDLDGDVPIPYQTYYEFPLNPDPTADNLPEHLYHNAIEMQEVGVHLNGVHIKGPSEAEGYNVDASTIPLLCGGHVTPPFGDGGVYHYHKASTCDHIEIVGEHGPLLGWANDGFGLYGFQDIAGMAPVVDECNGHFGPVSNNALENVFYHYHAHETTVMPSLTFESQEPTFQPYWIGCQGPSKGQCASTVAKAPEGMTDLDHNWCGVGCGFELCVQPGTAKADLEAYLETFGKKDWADGYTVNDYQICPECYRQSNTTLGKDAPSAEERHHHHVCKVCTEGVCAKCQQCDQPGKPSCDKCNAGGCLPSCNDCWSGFMQV